MKVRIEVEPGIPEPELTVKCGSIDENILKLQRYLSELDGEGTDKDSKKIVFYKDDTDFFFPVDNILFFETTAGDIAAHTKDDVFYVKQKLYELEEMLPRKFLRISKSTIINTGCVYSVSKNITGASKVCFFDSNKVEYVSRNYYKVLRERLIMNSVKEN